MARLADLAWPAVQARAAAGAVLAIPLGSTEQHGPHLPLSTDTELAVALCDRLAAAVPQVVVELVRSATATFDHVVLVSAHGGNAEPVERAARALRAESRDVLVVHPHWDGDPHAGRPETSLQLLLRPDAVDLTRAAAGNPAPLAELMPQLRRAGVRGVAPNGVLGDPAGASAEEGATLLAALAADLVDRVTGWLAGRR